MTSAGDRGGSGVTALTPYESSVRSQNGEDGVIAEILRRIGAPGTFFVEFGAETGAEGNTAALAESGWRGLLIEYDEAKFEALQARYEGNTRVETRRARVLPETFEALLDVAGVPEEPDVLSIDIDSVDWYVWEALERYRPRLVVVEYNAGLALARQLVVPFDADLSWDGTDYFGASLGAFERLGERKGYRLVHTDSTGVNAFFVRCDLLPGAGLPEGEQVARHPANYFGSGAGHPRDPDDRPWVDLERAGKLVRLGGQPAREPRVLFARLRRLGR